MRTVLIALGIGTESNANAIRDQGLKELNNFCIIDTDDIETILTAVRRPGKLISDPNDPRR